MLIIPGAAAISEFRKEKALSQIQKIFPGCRFVEAQFVYFLDLVNELEEVEKDTVAKLLNLESIDNELYPSVCETASTALSRTVIPRLGTISPWATKATEIFQHCGLGNVRRIERGVHWNLAALDETAASDTQADFNLMLAGLIYDPMTESILVDLSDAGKLFATGSPAPLVIIDLIQGVPGQGLASLKAANEEFGFALSEEEQNYLVERFSELGRNPTDVELMMFAQVNSEHCRHKIFNADWTVDGVDQEKSLFSMIRYTHEQNNTGTLSAYSDNAAALAGSEAERLAPNPDNKHYEFSIEPVHFTAKVETHNHPTAISPFPGASTGSGGEIRDEGATGRGGKPKAGLVGYSVSHLRLPALPQPWEAPEIKPARIASPLQIMLEGPIGAAAFNNEFGRPNIAGYFRCFEQVDNSGLNQASNINARYGYHKPIMLAGGLGNIRPGHIDKCRIPDGTPIVVLGGPTMLIGLGGGAASSVASGSSSASLDFASVQRGNPEMQRRCQEVIDACCAMGESNPILSIHDVGAGGLCNALPELVHDSESGGSFELRNILNDEAAMSPMQIWCNESQERYVLAIEQSRFGEFERICDRERCLYALVGTATDQFNLVLTDEYFQDTDAAVQKPIDLPMEVLFGLPPKMHRTAISRSRTFSELDLTDIDIKRATELVLSYPTVGDKTFLVTIGDRSVTGLIARDQMVGPWQVPVADVGVTASGYKSVAGEAFSIGERTPIAVINAPASARMAIGETITNLAAASIGDIGNIKLSANWMVAAGEAGQDADLYETVRSIALEICPQLGISIPVGKDSMSMKTVWTDEENRPNKVVAPLSLVISGFSAVSDVRSTLTPCFQDISGSTDIWLMDLGAGKNRMGASVLAQASSQIGNEPADLDDTQLLKRFFELVQQLNRSKLLLAYHDRSDGGLMTTLCEMAFASRCGLSISLDFSVDDHMALLFNEELGAVLQTRRSDRQQVLESVERTKLTEVFHCLGSPVIGDDIGITAGGKTIFQAKRGTCHQTWSRTSWQLQRMRDNPVCADQEHQRILDNADPGLFCELAFEHGDDQVKEFISSFSKSVKARPKIAILREQGVNGQLEMAAAFHTAEFDTVDVTMTDLANGDSLDDFVGLAACGGFSFGDVLGAGEGWGKSILFNNRLKDEFEKFFNRSDTFALGVCNGCQMMSSIKDLIPGAAHWPRFLRNTSEQYEARFTMVEVCSEQSILLKGMAGSRFPVSVAHGEGRAEFGSPDAIDEMTNQDQLCLRFVDNTGLPTQTYPYNPNGSIGGLTGFSNRDGRVTIMMPHPERVFRSLSNSWHPGDWGEFSPWIRIFQNARKWVG
jgi:phosphoribosylformylglycinamidine synthase